jgi:enoyl-CoA hydratase
MSDNATQFEIDRGIATITLDTPHNRNALSAKLVAEVTSHLETAAGDDAVRAVVLTHTGSTFCAGADLSEAKSGDLSTSTQGLLKLLRAIVELPKPVVARIDGHARAGGLGLLGACDIAIVGPSSTFAFTEARLGLAPAIISLTTLPRMSDSAGGRYFLTAETFDPAEAVAIGLATAAPDDVEAYTEEILAALRAASPQGLAESKLLTTVDMRTLLAERGDEVVALSARLFASEEAREGMQSFLERRPPAWAAAVS